MTYQTKLKVGDLIKIKGQVGPFIVIRSEHRQEDAYDGAPYWVDEIDVIKTSLARVTGNKGFTISIIDPAVKSFYFEGGCMTGKGKCIKDADVLVLGTTALTTKVSVTYTIGKFKLFN